LYIVSSTSFEDTYGEEYKFHNISIDPFGCSFKRKSVGVEEEPRQKKQLIK